MPALSYFSSADKSVGTIFVFLAVAVTWWPSHIVFKQLRKQFRSNATLISCITGCIALSIFFVWLGFWIAKVNTDFRNFLVSDEYGRTTADINIGWLPGGFLALGVWAGFISGYLKLKMQ